MASRHKQLAAGIIAAILASDVVLAAADLPYAPSIIWLFVTAYLSAQIGLHSVWIAIGRASWLVRFCTLFPVWVGIWLYLNAWTYMAVNELSLVYLAQAVVTAVCLLAMRAGRYRLITVAGQQRDPAAPASAGQYSIRDLMIVTALCGIATAGLMQLRLSETVYAPLIKLVGYGICIAAATLMSVVAALSTRRSLFPVLLVFTISCTLGEGFAMAVGASPWMPLVALLGGITLLLLTALLVLRKIGYRFQRKTEPPVQAAWGPAARPQS